MWRIEIGNSQSQSRPQSPIPGLLQPDGIVCDVEVVEDVVGFRAVQGGHHLQHTLQQLPASCVCVHVCVRKGGRGALCPAGHLLPGSVK